MDICDFHSHILPGADHGSADVETSIKQLELASLHEVTRIVATPHFYPHRTDVEKFLARRNRCYASLAENYNGNVDIRIGAEVLVCNNIENLPGIEDLCVFGTRVLLLELPFTDFSKDYVDSFGYLIDKGFTPLIAHADRYDPYNIDQLFRVGAYAQLNASSLTTLFKRKYLFDWISQGKIVALGSDIHGEDKKAYSNFVKAKKRIGDALNDIKTASDAIWNESKPFSM